MIDPKRPVHQRQSFWLWVMCLTGVVITKTLSAADAAEHLVHNPMWGTLPTWLQNRMLLTMLLQSRTRSGNAPARRRRRRMPRGRGWVDPTDLTDLTDLTGLT
jgi:hypothetical protein